jgi:hypothetical protein
MSSDCLPHQVRASYLVDDLAVEQRSRSSSAAASRSYVLLSEGFETAARPPKPLAYGAHLEARMCMQACMHACAHHGARCSPQVRISRRACPMGGRR